MLLKEQVAFISGASSGIGEATARLFAKEGARVGVHGRHQKDVEAVVASIRADGGEALPLIADMRDAAAVRVAVDTLAQHYGRLDIAFANAGINGVWAPIDDLTVEEFDETVAINLRGTFITVKFAYPYLRERGGSVIITSSVNGTRMFSNTGATAYACTKAGQVALGRMLALELARDKIRVNTICPGWISTEIEESTEKRDLEGIRPAVEFPEGMMPLTNGKPGKPRDVARLALFLASEQSRLITGTEVFIDAGESLLQG